MPVKIFAHEHGHTGHNSIQLCKEFVNKWILIFRKCFVMAPCNITKFQGRCAILPLVITSMKIILFSGMLNVLHRYYLLKRQLHVCTITCVSVICRSQVSFVKKKMVYAKKLSKNYFLHAHVEYSLRH